MFADVQTGLRQTRIVLSSQMKILLAEDDAGIRELMTTVLTRSGIEVDAVGDGATALRQLRSTAYEAVLLDLMLPRVNGFEVVRELRSASPRLLDRTIVVTAASEATLRDFDRSQVFALIRKPFDINDLLGTIASCTAAKASHAM